MSKNRSLKVSEKEGNNEASFSKQSDKHNFYCFTIYNYIDHYDEIVSFLQLKSKKGYLGHEICPTTKNKHLQGFFELKKRSRFTELKLPFGDARYFPTKGSEDQNMTYCSKENGTKLKWGYPIPLKLITDLFEWQKEVKDICLTEPDDRTVNWYWDPIGKIGKTQFIKYMCHHHKILPTTGGSERDIINMVFNQNMDETRCVMFNIARCKGSKISYASLEAIKDGLICNTKYETGYKMFNSPHVFVFANFAPDAQEYLSEDRWNIVQINKKWPNRKGNIK
nr:MAG: replication associated protein [Cressdnaviricota sp.]